MRKLIISFLLCCCIYAGILRPQQHVTQENYDVHVEIHNQLAITTITQRFHNHTNHNVEIIYQFSIPTAAKIHHLSMWINDREMSGAIVEKNNGRRIYAAITKIPLVDPALLEYQGNGKYQIRIFPVLPHKPQKIKIIYWEMLCYETGLINYKYLSSSQQHFNFTASIFSIMPIVDFKCTQSAQKTQRTSSQINLNLSTQDNIEFSYRVKCDQWRIDFAFFRPSPRESGYFTAMVTSPQNRQQPIAKAVTFVLDISASMTGEKIQKARQALIYGIKSLREQDTFNVIAFNYHTKSMSKTLLNASVENKNLACKFVSKLQAQGKTNIYTAVHEALQLKALSPHMVILITDGKDDSIHMMENVHRRNTRLFTFGIGSDTDVKFLGSLAHDNGGTYQFITQQNIDIGLAHFFDKISRPVLSNVKVYFSNAQTHDIFPKIPNEMFDGSQMIFSGKFRNHGQMPITIVGDAASQKIKIRSNVEFPQQTQNSFAAKALWMNQQIDFLLCQEYKTKMQPKFSTATQSIKNKIIALSKEAGIMTPYTSYLVLEKDADYKKWQIIPNQYLKPNLAQIPLSGRFGGKNLVKRGGGAPVWLKTESLLRNLNWLVAQQQNGRGGSISSTALSLLCFLQIQDKDFASSYIKIIKNAQRFIRKAQQKNGLISHQQNLRDHVIATFVLAKLYSKDTYSPLIRLTLLKSFAYCLEQMQENTLDDLEVNTWLIMAIREAQRHYIKIPQVALLEKFIYNNIKAQKADNKNILKTAMTIVTLQQLGDKNTVGLAKKIACVQNTIPKLHTSKFWYFATLAVHKEPRGNWLRCMEEIFAKNAKEKTLLTRKKGEKAFFEMVFATLTLEMLRDIE